MISSCKKAPRHDKIISDCPFFSIVIPTLNEEVCLPLLLNDLSLQRCADFEIIHVDGGSTDKTLEKAKQWNDKLNIRTISYNIKNVSAQRNRGAEGAKGNWIIFMDADDRLPDYFLDDVKRNIEISDNDSKKRFDIFTTLLQLANDNKKDARYPAIVGFLNIFLYMNGKMNSKTHRPAAIGSMIGIRRAVFKDARFNENSKICEDSIFVRDCMMLKWKYTIMTHPTYVYSMRRIKSNGVFRTSVASLIMHFRYLIGDDFSNKNYGYEMLGGGAYLNDNIQERKKP